MPIVLTQSTTSKIAAACLLAQGILAARFVLKVDRLSAQAKFLADIVRRNADNLEEFDIIALRELGMLKENR